MLLHRRALLASAAWLVAGTAIARAELIRDQLPWQPNAGHPPTPARPGPWLFFSADEAADVEAICDRFIPPDPKTPGGKDAGCGVYIDRQLAGPYGRDEGLYREGPFREGTKSQGMQSKTTRAQLYRKALAALQQHCRKVFNGKGFAQLDDNGKDAVLHDLDTGKLKFDGVDGQAFFNQILKDVKQGFFADPIYGGNRNMVSWRMIGFPGTRYNYLDWIDRHNERYPLPPVSIAGAPEWTPQTSNG